MENRRAFDAGRSPANAQIIADLTPAQTSELYDCEPGFRSAREDLGSDFEADYRDIVYFRGLKLLALHIGFE